ncbi:hypothetical protein D3C72_2010930 [compost metagenome]
MIAQEGSSSVDLTAISILHRHGLESVEALEALLEYKAKNTQNKLEQLILENADVDCGELNRRFSEMMFQPDKIEELHNFHEENRSHFGVCSQIEQLQSNLDEIESARKEIFLS